MTEVILAILLSLAIFVFAGQKLIKFKWQTTSVTRIGIVSGLTILLYSIKLVPFPQGGGCSLLSVLPIMILALLYGMEEAFICAIVVGLVKIIIAPPFFPLQVPLDYLGAMMALALTPIFGRDHLLKVFSGALLAASLSTFFSILSGIIFFGQYAPEGMHVWIYSAIYNITGYGVEAGLSILILLILYPRLNSLEVGI